MNIKQVLNNKDFFVEWIEDVERIFNGSNEELFELLEGVKCSCNNLKEAIEFLTKEATSDISDLYKEEAIELLADISEFLMLDLQQKGVFYMLPYKVIKDDIKNGYDYMEYEGEWYGWEYTFILEGENVLLVFKADNPNSKDGGYFLGSYKIKKECFLNIKSYKELTKIANETCYYSSYYI